MMQQKKCECGREFWTAKASVIICKPCRSLSYRINGKERRKKRLESAPGFHNTAEWQKRIEDQNRLCFWCHRPLDDDQKQFRGTRDHLTPLIRGGSDRIENIVAACWPCNREKGKRTAREYVMFLAKQGRPFSDISTLPASTGVGSSVTSRRRETARDLALQVLHAEHSQPREFSLCACTPEVQTLLTGLALQRRMPDSAIESPRRSALKRQAAAMMLEQVKRETFGLSWFWRNPA